MSLDKFNTIKEDHPLTDDEMRLLTEVSKKQNPQLSEALQEIHDSALELRIIERKILNPQSASEIKKHGTLLRKIGAIQKKEEALAKRVQATIDKKEKLELQLEELNSKFEEFELSKEVLEKDKKQYEEEADLIGPNRLTSLSEEYLSKLSSLMEFSLEVEDLTEETEASFNDINEELPYLEAYTEEYLNLENTK